MKRRLFFVAVCLCAIGILLPSRPAAAADPAAVVTSLGNQALKVLGKNVDPNLRVARFRQLFSADFDVPGIARFVLGRYWRVATPAQQQEFLKLFTDYIALAYSNRLAEYSGETLRVTGSRPAPDGRAGVERDRARQWPTAGPGRLAADTRRTAPTKSAT